METYVGRGNGHRSVGISPAMKGPGSLFWSGAQAVLGKVPVPEKIHHGCVMAGPEGFHMADICRTLSLIFDVSMFIESAVRHRRVVGPPLT